LLLLCIASGAMGQPLSDLESIFAADRAFDAATAEGGAAGWVSYFAPGGSMHLASGRTVTGHEAILALMEPAFADPGYSLRWHPENGSMVIPGILGYTTGPYEQRSQDEAGRTVVTRGTYVSMWKKQDDGTWKIILDTGHAEGEPEILED
jgi:ketosteroid isomerase-like protein